MADPFVITVILNTNRRDDTLETLGSLAKSTYPNLHILVLDNASTDGSIDAIQKEYPDVQIIELDENLGYAGNNNVGIQAAMEQGADWVFVLNEDTIVDPACISHMIAAAVEKPDAGILGPLVYHYDEPTVIQTAGGLMDNYWQAYHLGQNQPDQGQFSGVRQVDWISGCAILVNRQVIEQVGSLDKRFFYYWEETDWCLRAHEAGWRLYCVSTAKLWHKGVQRDYRPSPNVTYYSSRNRLLLLKKHHAPLHVWSHTAFQTIRTLSSWTIRPKWRSMREHRDAMWQGTVDFLQKNWGIRS